MNDTQDRLCAAFGAVSFVAAVVLMVIHGWNWMLTFLALALLLNAWVMGLRLKLADARRSPPLETFGVPADPEDPPPPKNPTQEAVSGAVDFLHFVFPDRSRREVMAHDLARAAAESGHPEFAQHLRASF